jgi:hypothetical protein
MSKKSRKRNKKILAAIGIGLGAAALASRKKKSDLAATEDNKSGSTKITGGTNLNDYDAGTKKSDFITKKDTSNKGSGSNVRTRGRIVDSSGDTVASAGTAVADNKSKVTNVTRPGDNMYSNAGSSNPKSRNFRKDGGRMGLRSGGKAIKKSMGKALRGGGKVMR